MKQKADLSDNLQKTFQEENGSANKSPGNWLDNEQLEKKNTGRSFIRDPYLGHAAGDYEPLEKDSRFHRSDDLEPIANEERKKSSFARHKDSPTQPFDGQIGKQERVLLEGEKRSEQIEEIRATYGAMNHNRP
ncbi:hypothetical protein [Sporosarcina sp. JAI121]|uniref:hypothetical protein n=1 Tax=Sporosarcina sp. JAI121 TaxID=2723064 RepID=UPI0015CD3F3A|nr:hypothetical protein [Sporosarcina sp. JAI121]NYF23875.1 hypothetical protein [Sporosarcina sp. JAI121]